MNVTKKAVDILNLDLVPIIAVDQPLYMLAKQVQWSWPASHGEDQFAVMFGGLHIEMVALDALGDLLESSGWIGSLIQASLATHGKADSFLKASHVTCTRHTNQITVCSLYLLQQKAYTEYCNGVEEGCNKMSLEDWCDQRAEPYPLFLFRSIILQMEREVLIYARVIRDGDFLLYIDALTKIVPWFFALGHTNYARWIPVHLRDMVSLNDNHPGVFAEFRKGMFCEETAHVFSDIAIDQAHQQNNASVKGDGGAMGLTEYPAALRRWILSSPEMARLIGKFEVLTKKRMKTDFRHREQKNHAHTAFGRDITSLNDVIELSL